MWQLLAYGVKPVWKPSLVTACRHRNHAQVSDVCSAIINDNRDEHLAGICPSAEFILSDLHFADRDIRQELLSVCFHQCRLIPLCIKWTNGWAPDSCSDGAEVLSRWSNCRVMLLMSLHYREFGVKRSVIVSNSKLYLCVCINTCFCVCICNIL